MFRKSLFLAMGLAAALTVSQARAGTVTLDLDTGVNGSGASLPAFSPDSHYTLEAAPVGAILLAPLPTPAIVADSAFFPFPVWSNASTLPAQWIEPAGSPTLGNPTQPNGNYYYQTTFDIGSSAVLSSIKLALSLLSDDQIISVTLNGHSIYGPASPPAAPIGTPTLVGAGVPSSDFLIGGNTLLIDSRNEGGYTTGINVVGSVTYTTAIPEPASMALLGIGLSGLFTLRRFFKRTSVA